MQPEGEQFLTLLTSTGSQGVLIAALVWFGRRILAQNDRLVASIERATDELRASREAMDDARLAFERRRKEQHEQPQP